VVLSLENELSLSALDISLAEAGMASIAKIVRANHDVKWLRPALNHLGGVIDDFIEWDKEPPYWNNEAASVSLLVAAATRAGYDVALSDYRRDKRNQSKGVKGRCDFLIGKGDRYLEIEAKQAYIGPGKQTKTIEGKLEKSV
jgi:hypothetical protein